MKKILLCFTTVCALITAFVFSGSNVSAASTSFEDAAAQENAYMAYEELMNSFTISEETGEKCYPEYYGGSYITDDDVLVIYTKDLDKITNVGINNDSIRYEKCEYSYNELLDIMEVLNEYKQQRPDDIISQNFNVFGLYDSLNRVVVRLDDLSEESILEFKKNVCDNEAIVFEQGNGPAELEVSVNPGSSISTSGYVGSVGYRVKKNGVSGFVTAGHLASYGDTIYYGGTAFASCTASQQSGSVDGAFCSITNSNYSVTNTLNGTSNTLSTVISEPGVGTVINKIGQSTNHTSGKITSTSVTVTFTSGNTITNLTEADYTSAPGDSGCVVYSYVSSSNTRYTLGIHTGANGSKRYYTKANQINAALGTSRY